MNMKFGEKDSLDYGMKYKHEVGIILILLILSFILSVNPVFGAGDFKFDFAAKVAGPNNFTKHWSNAYPPDPNANIIIYSYTGNISFKRMSAISYVYVTYDSMGNVVAVDKNDMFQRNYEPLVYYYVFHPRYDWIEGNYKTRIIVYNRIDRDAWENLTSDAFGIAADVDKYKKFYETGSNANNVGAVKGLGETIAQTTLYFKIDKSASIYPPDRFLIHDLAFIDGKNERVIGEQLQIEVKVDNNYAEDGSFKLALLVDNSIIATQDITVKGYNTSTVTFDAKAGKVGNFKLNVGADIPDAKMKNTELMFTIKNESESTILGAPKIEITGMNVDKEFVTIGTNVTVSITTVNKGKAGDKTITIYSNKMPVGSTTVNLQYLEEKTVDIPVTLANMGINKITVSDAPQLYRNVFVQESEAQKSPVQRRLEDNPLKVSAIVVFLIFAVVLYYLRKKLMK